VAEPTNTDQQYPAEDQMTDEERAQWAQWDVGARRWAKIQSEEQSKERVAREWENLGAKDDKAAREFIRKTCGFDPGW